MKKLDLIYVYKLLYLIIKHIFFYKRQFNKNYI